LSSPIDIPNEINILSLLSFILLSSKELKNTI